MRLTPSCRKLEFHNINKCTSINDYCLFRSVEILTFCLIYIKAARLDLQLNRYWFINLWIILFPYNTFFLTFRYFSNTWKYLLNKNALNTFWKHFLIQIVFSIAFQSGSRPTSIYYTIAQAYSRTPTGPSSFSSSLSEPTPRWWVDWGQMILKIWLNPLHPAILYWHCCHKAHYIYIITNI